VPHHSLCEQRRRAHCRTVPEAYAAFAAPVLAAFADVTAVTSESDVAEAVYRAANDASRQLRFPAGADAVALAQSR